MESISSQDQAYQQIKNKILYNNYYPGEKLSEKGIETQLSIGRTPVREALIRLKKEELIFTKAQSGTYVSKINLESANQARFIREHLEKLIILEACMILKQQHIQAIESILAKQQEALLNRHSLAFFLLDDEFHQYFYKITHREKIWEWMALNNTHLTRFRWLRLDVLKLKWDKIVESHHDIFNAIKTRNPEEAQFLTAMHLHMMIDEKQTLMEAFPNYFD